MTASVSKRSRGTPARLQFALNERLFKAGFCFYEILKNPQPNGIAQLRRRVDHGQPTI